MKRGNQAAFVATGGFENDKIGFERDELFDESADLLVGIGMRSVPPGVERSGVKGILGDIDT